MGCKKLLADNLVILMRRDAITRKSLAKTLGIRPSSVSRWVAGTSWPSAESFDEIGRSFGWSMIELMALNSDKTARAQSLRQTVTESKIIESLNLASALSLSIIDALKVARDHIRD